MRHQGRCSHRHRNQDILEMMQRLIHRRLAGKRRIFLPRYHRHRRQRSCLHTHRCPHPTIGLDRSGSGRRWYLQGCLHIHRHRNLAIGMHRWGRSQDCCHRDYRRSCHHQHLPIGYHHLGMDRPCSNSHHHHDQDNRIGPLLKVQLGLDNRLRCFHPDCFRIHRCLHRTIASHRSGMHPHRNNRYVLANLHQDQSIHHHRYRHNRVCRRVNRPKSLDIHRVDHSSVRRQPNRRRYLSTVFGRVGRRRYFAHQR